MATQGESPEAIRAMTELAQSNEGIEVAHFEVKTKTSIPEDLKETRSPAIVLTENFDEAQEVVKTVEVIKARNGKTSTIKSVKSVYSALPKKQNEKIAVITRIRTLVDDSENFFWI